MISYHITLPHLPFKNSRLRPSLLCHGITATYQKKGRSRTWHLHKRIGQANELRIGVEIVGGGHGNEGNDLLGTEPGKVTASPMVSNGDQW